MCVCVRLCVFVCWCLCYLHVGGVQCCITFNVMCVYSMHVCVVGSYLCVLVCEPTCKAKVCLYSGALMSTRRLYGALVEG